MQLWSSQAKDLFGIDINWTPSSSASGLDAFAAGTDDFAASDLPFGLGVESTTPDQPYQYLPTASSGLAFMFNLNGNDGQRITNLNLNPLVIAQIFLGEITNWNSPQIAVANPQLAGDLPNQTIYPVYRTDASGDNYLLSDYLLHQDGGNFTAAQNAFQSTLPDQPAVTWPIPSPSAHVDRSLYPGWVAGNPIGENGPANAANYVAAPSSVGSITYVETGYAEAQDLPVANLANASGANVQPTALNVATALEAASLQPGHTQDLTNVYTNPLPDVYPLSSVSYMIAPCSPSLAAAQGTACDGPSVPTSFPAAKGQALGQFVYNMACAGQQGMANLGLSPLPPNLVQDDFNAIGRLVGADEPATPTATNCANPTIDGSMPLPT
jgi:phosphate transport system substrate-binding protein